MQKTAPLINRQPQEEIAWLTQSLPSLNNKTGAISAEQFLSHVSALAKVLPDNHHCINLCHNRYLFMVVFCAVITRQQTNLLPSNKNAATQTRLAQRYTKTYTVHDGLEDLAAGIEMVNLQEISLVPTQESCFGVPQIDLDQLAAISFTSGSTGDAKAILKSWRTFVVSTDINARYMLLDQDKLSYHLATVPSQHMWGLETTVLMALLAPVCMVDAQPFYPQDIFSILRKLPLPRAIITTPLHLRAINVSGVSDVELRCVLIATAPLDRELAQSIETKLNTQIREVYGCSEVGSMSIRQPVKTEQWTRFDGLNFVPTDEGGTIVTAEHLPDQVTLDDQITMLDEDHFLLAGRNTDQINIAGKRGSLLEVNTVLMKYPGLIDGIVIFPPQDRSVPRLVALVVLSSDQSKQSLRKHFSKYLDSAFVPRPIIVVDRLPREENGKLIKNKLLELYQTTLKRDKPIES